MMNLLGLKGFITLMYSKLEPQTTTYEFGGVALIVISKGIEMLRFNMVNARKWLNEQV
jgi:hypothetical protein